MGEITGQTNPPPPSQASVAKGGKILTTVGEKSVLGEIAFLTPGGASATVTALEGGVDALMLTEVLFLDFLFLIHDRQEAITNVAQNNNKVAALFYKMIASILADRLVKLQNRLNS
jgi:CRP-like cAMP-binding protein